MFRMEKCSRNMLIIIIIIIIIITFTFPASICHQCWSAGSTLSQG